MSTTSNMLRGCYYPIRALARKGALCFYHERNPRSSFQKSPYVGSKSEATRVYDEAMRKTHWHLATLTIAHSPPTPSSTDAASTVRLDDSVRANCTLPIPGSALHGRSIQTSSAGTALNTSSIDDGSSAIARRNDWEVNTRHYQYSQYERATDSH